MCAEAAQKARRIRSDALIMISLGLCARAHGASRQAAEVLPKEAIFFAKRMCKFAFEVGHLAQNRLFHVQP